MGKRGVEKVCLYTPVRTEKKSKLEQILPIKFMKRKIFILPVFLIIANMTYGQFSNSQVDTTRNPNKILYVLILPNKPPVATENVILAPVDIDTLYDITNVSMKLSGLLRVSNVWVLRLSAYAQLFSLNQILNLFDIKKEDQNLPVRIDDLIVDYPETILAEEREIIKIEIVNNKDNPFINIKTRNPGRSRKRSKTGILIH